MRLDMSLSSEETRYDAIIIGAGFSGLAAGLRCAMFDKRVLIVESHSVWGGLNSFYKRGGYHFDVGLHALTNFPSGTGRRTPLERVCRQLRLRFEDLEISPQRRSKILFDDAELSFGNGLACLESEVEKVFPREIDGFRTLAEACSVYPEFGLDTPFQSGRAFLGTHLGDPLLIEMLLCPLMYYGCASPGDIDRELFVILFNSIYREGFCRPRRGIRQILDILVKRYREQGGEMRRRCPVQSLEVEAGAVRRVVFEDGTSVTAPLVISSAGFFETTALRSDADVAPVAEPGSLGFVESLWVLDAEPQSWGWEPTVAFFHKGGAFPWRCPNVPVDVHSGVISSPGNYAIEGDDGASGFGTPMLRATHLANPAFWMNAEEGAYRAAKDHWVGQSQASIERYVGPFANRIQFTDAFTPRTVKRFTRHENGAIYGSHQKQKSGRTDLSNLYLCGTDQGYVGIVGAMLSGVLSANAFVLQ
jgi:phytoene dehydrogenase-like protein